MELLGDPLYKPMRLRELAMLLNLKKPERRDLYEILEELEEEGRVASRRKRQVPKGDGQMDKGSRS